MYIFISFIRDELGLIGVVFTKFEKFLSKHFTLLKVFIFNHLIYCLTRFSMLWTYLFILKVVFNLFLDIEKIIINKTSFIFLRIQHCYLSKIRFANWVQQESELFNLFLSNKVSNSKSEFQTRFETRSRYSHTPPETAVVVNRERINNLLRSIYVGSNWNPNTITNP